MFDSWRGFTASTLPPDWHQKLTEQARPGMFAAIS